MTCRVIICLLSISWRLHLLEGLEHPQTQNDLKSKKKYRDAESPSTLSVISRHQTCHRTILMMTLSATTRRNTNIKNCTNKYSMVKGQNGDSSAKQAKYQLVSWNIQDLHNRMLDFQFMLRRYTLSGTFKT
ncbi:uncharacterized protein [Ptychodera flava]|uniref:uncharacterized protein n=1 Tax=Ptychodera flava TaxID=63121 RepID=UPI003969C147